MTRTDPALVAAAESKVEREIIASTKRAAGDLNKRRASYKRPPVREPYVKTKHSRDHALDAAARQVELLAGYRNEVRDHVALELAMTADGARDHTLGASDPEVKRQEPLTGKCGVYVPLGDDAAYACGRSRPCGDHDAPVVLTAVERAADRRLRLEQKLADFDAQCRLIAVAAADALQSRDSIMRTRLSQAEVEKLNECFDGQIGKDGAIEWGDPLCRAPLAKGGMCQAHYSKWVRWRTTHGKKTPDIEDAA